MSLDNEKGQGLIEMLIAIAIILTAVVGGLTLMVASFNANRESEFRTVAANLAREAVEICKNERNSTWLNGAVFESWFTNPDLDYSAVPVFDEVAGEWTLDFFPDDISDPEARVFSYTIGDYSGLMNNFNALDSEETKYRRMIYFNPICWDAANSAEHMISDGEICAPDEVIGVKIRAITEWQDRGTTHDVDLELRLYNWRYR